MVKAIKFINNKYFLLFVTIFVLGLATVVAGDVIVQEGSMALDDDFSVGTNNLFVDVSTGRVGVGTANPEYKLHALVTGSGNRPYIMSEAVGGAEYSGYNLKTEDVAGSTIAVGSLVMNKDGDVFLANGETAGSATNNLVVKGTGKVGVGTTSPASKLDVSVPNADAGLKVSRNTASNSQLLELNQQASGGNGALASAVFKISNSGANPYFNFGDAFWMTIDDDIRYTGTLAQSSDRRLKENIVQIEEPLEKLDPVVGVYYNMIGDDDRRMGVLAQDVQTTLPEAVVVDDWNGYLGVSYDSLIPVLVEAVKDQQDQIEEQQMRIEELSKEIEDLQKKCS